MTQEHELKRIWLMDLLDKCPREKPRGTCHLAPLVRLPRKERLITVWALKDDQVDDLITAHKACSRGEDRP